MEDALAPHALGIRTLGVTELRMALEPDAALDDVLRLTT
jgi:hypothetical protein